MNLWFRFQIPRHFELIWRFEQALRHHKSSRRLPITFNRSGTLLISTKIAKMHFRGQWLWLSWKSGCFQLQRSVVWIQSPAKFNLNVYFQRSTVLKRWKLREKRREKSAASQSSSNWSNNLKTIIPYIYYLLYSSKVFLKMGQYRPLFLFIFMFSTCNSLNWNLNW